MFIDDRVRPMYVGHRTKSGVGKPRLKQTTIVFENAAAEAKQQAANGAQAKGKKVCA